MVSDKVCYGGNCALRFDCLRFLELDTGLEEGAFALTPPYNYTDGIYTCDEYLDANFNFGNGC